MQNFNTEVPGTAAPDTNAPELTNIFTQQPAALTNTVPASSNVDLGMKKKKRPVMKLAVDDKRSQPGQQLG